MASEALALVCQNKEFFLFVRRELVRGLPHLGFNGSANVMSANKARYLFAMIIDYSRFFRVVRMCSKDKTSHMKVDQDEP